MDPVEGGISVNIGDMLARWSDGRLLSNLHRVRMPSAASGDDASRSRYSIGFFLQADKRALIECTQSEPITAGDYLLGRIRANFDSASNTSSAAARTKSKSSRGFHTSGGRWRRGCEPARAERTRRAQMKRTLSIERARASSAPAQRVVGFGYRRGCQATAA